MVRVKASEEGVPKGGGDKEGERKALKSKFPINEVLLLAACRHHPDKSNPKSGLHTAV